MGEYACHSFHIEDAPICAQGCLQVFHLNQQRRSTATLIPHALLHFTKDKKLVETQVYRRSQTVSVSVWCCEDIGYWWPSGQNQSASLQSLIFLFFHFPILHISIWYLLHFCDFVFCVSLDKPNLGSLLCLNHIRHLLFILHKMKCCVQNNTRAFNLKIIPVQAKGVCWDILDNIHLSYN